MINLQGNLDTAGNPDVSENYHFTAIPEETLNNKEAEHAKRQNFC
jgi:hypothetical protein